MAIIEPLSTIKLTIDAGIAPTQSWAKVPTTPLCIEIAFDSCREVAGIKWRLCGCEADTEVTRVQKSEQSANDSKLFQRFCNVL